MTKMSYLHFTASETYRNRVIQLGESPDRVFNVGALGVENILHTQLFSYEDICREIGIPNDQKYVVVTFHPVTQEPGEEQHQTQELIAAMREKSWVFLFDDESKCRCWRAEGERIIGRFFREST